MTRNTLSSFSSVRSKHTTSSAVDASVPFLRLALPYIHARGTSHSRLWSTVPGGTGPSKEALCSGWSLKLPPTRFERSHGSSAPSQAARRLDPSSRAPRVHTRGMRRKQFRSGCTYHSVLATPHSAFAWSTCCQSSSLPRVSGKASSEAPGWTAAATAATSTRAVFGTGRRCR